MQFYRLIFYVLTFYTWALAMFLDRESYTDSVAVYIATAAPAAIFIVLCAPLVIRRLFPRSTLCLMAMLGLVIVISAARLDYTTILSVGSLCAMLIAMDLSGISLSCRFVNGLFILSIITTAALHAGGIGHYGILPGQSDDPVEWRASLFAWNVVTGWLFALVVLGINYFRGGRFRWAYMLLALYFIVLASSRTALIVVALCGLFLFCKRHIRFRPRFFYRAFIPFVTLLFVISLNAEGVLALFVGLNNPVVNAIVLRSEGADTTDQVSSSIVRTQLWAAHAEIFMSSPLAGAGTFNLQDRVALDTESIGSETFLTGIFARMGLSAVLFLMFIYYRALESVYDRNLLGYCLMILFAISSLAYGSYIVPYDFVFMVLFGAFRHLGSVDHVRAANDDKRRASY